MFSARTSAPLRLAALVLGLVGGGCSGDVGGLRSLGIGGSAPRGPVAPAFVTETRRENADFLPVGVSAPPRPVRAKSSEGQKALEAELEGARSRNLARGKAAESVGKAVNPAPAP
jgi:hypothetical protein